MCPIKPPAKESPAPVGSTISSNGYAEAGNTKSAVTNKDPFSPFFTMTNLGPQEIIIFAHFTKLVFLHNNLASSSLITTPSTDLIISTTLSREFKIQYSMVSQITNLRFKKYFNILRFWHGSLLAR